MSAYSLSDAFGAGVLQPKLGLQTRCNLRSNAGRLACMEGSNCVFSGPLSINHMKLDPLQQYARLREQLRQEQSQLQSRLNEINQVLGSESGPTPAATSSSPQPASTPVARRGRRARGSNALSLREAVLKALSNGPVARKDLVGAVESVGYRFTTKHPLNSIGSILYGKNSQVTKSADGGFMLKGGRSANVGASATNGSTATEPVTKRRKRRKMSAQGRARIAAAQKARWAKVNRAAK